RRSLGENQTQPHVGAIVRAAAARHGPCDPRWHARRRAGDVPRWLADSTRARRDPRWPRRPVRLSPVEQTYYRKGFGRNGAIEGALAADYHSRVVDAIRTGGYRLTVGDVTFQHAVQPGDSSDVDHA